MAICSAIIELGAAFNENKTPPPLNYRYFFESVTTGYIDDCARNWLALNLTSKQLKTVLDMLRDYPATSQDEAIETVLLIFINRTDYERI